MHYVANENLASQCEFVYNKDIRGNILVPKDKASKISEFILGGIFEIDPRYFFMTSDGKWNQNNPLGNRFDQVKATCQLIPIKRNEDFSIINDDFSTIVKNIRAIQTIANPHKSRDVSSFLIGNPPNIKIIHHLFVVSPRFYYITVQISLTHPTGKKFRL